MPIASYSAFTARVAACISAFSPPIALNRWLSDSLILRRWENGIFANNVNKSVLGGKFASMGAILGINFFASCGFCWMRCMPNTSSKALPSVGSNVETT